MSSSCYLILDVETTGLPKCPAWGRYHPPHMLEMYDSSRIVQIAWTRVDQAFAPIEKYESLIKPRVVATEPEIVYDFVHDGEASRINGITQAELLDNGRHMGEVLDQLLFTLNLGVTHFVAHNAGFDWNILRSECERLGRHDVLEKLSGLQVICTMRETRHAVNLPGRNGPKMPRLIELFHHCYGANAQLPGTQHRADADVEILRLCLVKLRERQLEKQRKHQSDAAEPNKAA